MVLYVSKKLPQYNEYLRTYQCVKNNVPFNYLTHQEFEEMQIIANLASLIERELLDCTAEVLIWALLLMEVRLLYSSLDYLRIHQNPEK